MASGFLILSDGRCFARHWSAYDFVLQSVARELDSAETDQEGEAFRDWLRSLVPGPEDEADLGQGSWLRKRDQEVVERYLDLREVTPANQRRFNEAAEAARDRLLLLHTHAVPQDLTESLLDVVDMVRRVRIGESPLSKSDWRYVVPVEGRRVGPGWSRE